MASCTRAPFYRSKQIAADTADGCNFFLPLFWAEITLRRYQSTERKPRGGGPPHKQQDTQNYFAKVVDRNETV